MGIVSLDLKDLDGEIWKDIPGYEGLYSVSNKGRVKSLSHLTKRGFCECFTDECILNPQSNGNYFKVGLSKGNANSIKQIFIHRIVATTFLPNPNNLPQIDHLDGNKANNCVENLRWCTQVQNINNPNTKYRSKTLRKVASYNLLGEKIEEFLSLADASRKTGVPISSICCIAKGLSGMNGSKYGLVFKYV